MHGTSIAGVKTSKNAGSGKELGERPVTNVGNGGEEVRERCKATWGSAGLGKELLHFLLEVRGSH